MKTLTAKTSLAALAAAALLVLLPATAVAKGPAVEPEKLEKLAAKASTPAEHATVAKQYRLRAEALDATAEKHEAEARKLSNGPANPMAAKWPAMAGRSAQTERQLAVQARRAAQECYARADHHLRLAVEAQLAE